MASQTSPRPAGPAGRGGLFRLGEAVELLERTPGALRALVGGLSEPWLAANEGPATFDTGDVLCHLIYGEETDWIPRIRIILEQGESRPFTPFDRHGGKRLRHRPPAELLDTLARLRAENLRALAGFALSEADLARRGTHPALGPVTLAQYIAAWTVHDLGHLAQITRILARRYAAAVGPLREYLTIVKL